MMDYHVNFGNSTSNSLDSQTDKDDTNIETKKLLTNIPLHSTGSYLLVIVFNLT